MKRVMLALVLSATFVSPALADAREIECLAKNLYFEARSESIEGQYVPAFVTMNRVHDDRFPATVCEVVYQAKMKKSWKGTWYPVRNRCQFSWFCDGMADEIHNWKKYHELEILAAFIYTYYGQLEDPTRGAIFYHSLKQTPRSFASYKYIDKMGSFSLYTK